MDLPPWSVWAPGDGSTGCGRSGDAGGLRSLPAILPDQGGCNRRPASHDLWTGPLVKRTRETPVEADAKGSGRWVVLPG